MIQFLTLVLVFVPVKETDITAFLEHRQEGIKAYRAGDYAGFLEHTQQAHQIMPDHAASLYNLALGFAMLEQPDQAVAILTRLAEMGLYFDVAKNEVFAALGEARGYREMVAHFERNRQPVGETQVAYTLNRRDFYPEGICMDAKTGTLWVGSIHHREIVRLDAKGVITPFAGPEQGLMSVLAMKLSAKGDQLMVTSSGLPQSKDLKPEQLNTSALLVLDPSNGKVRAQYGLAVPGEKHNLGDLVLSRRGDVYLTDSSFSAIYKLRQGGDRLELLMKSDLLRSPQGICFSKDEDKLFVADYAHGLMMVDLDDGSIQKMKLPGHMSLGGIDGLNAYQDHLIAICNGYRPHRVLRIILNDAGNEIVGQTVLASNLKSFDEPTLGTVVGSQFLFVANSQWGRYTKDNKPLPLDKLEEIQILKLDL